jgi:hypothetical protein
MIYKASGNTPYKNINCCEGEASNVLCHCICQKWVNQMWILKTSKELLESLKLHFVPQIYRMKTYDFTTLYTTIPHDKLKTILFGIIDSCYFNKNSKRKYSYLVVNHSRTYFVIHNSTHKYSEVDIEEMLGSSFTTFL